MHRGTRVAGLVLGLHLLAGAPVVAQTIGPFTWQTQPYCNRLTVTITQVGGVFQLTGTDDLCGTGLATVSGTATLGGPGVIMGLTVSRPDGRVASLSAAVPLTLSGTWVDAGGFAGQFVFNGATSAAGPRPDPGSFRKDLILGAVVASNGALVRGVGATSATRLAAGQYRVGFNRSVVACVWTATSGDDVNGNWPNLLANVALSGDGTGTSLFIDIRHTGTLASTDSYFHTIVVCP